MKFFDKIFENKKSLEARLIETTSALQVFRIAEEENLLLKVENNQIACLFNENQFNHYNSGSYVVTAENIRHFQYLMFVKYFQFNEHFYVQTERDDKVLNIFTEVSMELSNQDLLMLNLIRMIRNNPQTIPSFPQFFIKKISEFINHNQEISLEDFKNHADKVSAFLFPILQQYFNKFGVNVKNLSLELKEEDIILKSDLQKVENENLNENNEQFSKSKRFYYYQNENRIGPLSINEVQELINQKKLTGDSNIWEPKMSSWRPIRSLGIFNLEDEN